MHIPDGFLDFQTLAVTDAAAGAALLFSVWRVNRKLEPRRIPLLGMCAAFVFTAQLLSFPVPGGTSTHLCGAVLVSILLGPFSGLAIVSSALILQALLFQHGGLWTMGANIINIGVVGCWFGYGLNWVLRLASKRLTMLSAGLTAWTAMVLGASLAALELSFSGLVPLNQGILAMAGAHALTGVFEALATVLILGALTRARPDLLELEKI